MVLRHHRELRRPDERHANDPSACLGAPAGYARSRSIACRDHANSQAVAARPRICCAVMIASTASRERSATRACCTTPSGKRQAVPGVVVRSNQGVAQTLEFRAEEDTAELAVASQNCCK
jgi:hypothetical protein